MKKQLLALTCAVTLGVGGAVIPAAGQSVEPTGQIGYAVARHANSGGAGEAAGAGAGGAAGGQAGKRMGSNLGNGYRVVRGMSARIAIVRVVATGARTGATLGSFGGLAGMLIGAAVGAA